MAFADSGLATSSQNEQKAAKRLQTNDNSARFKIIAPEDATKNFACYNGKYIIPEVQPIMRVNHLVRPIHNSRRQKSEKSDIIF